MSIREVSEQLPEGEPATPTPPESVDSAETASAGERSRFDLPSEMPLPRWLLNLIGHVLAALLGLILGYLILALLRPLTFPLPWYH